MTANPTWAGLGHGTLVLAVIWSAWVCYAWLTNLIEPEEGAVRIIHVRRHGRAPSSPSASRGPFDERALAFAVAYAVVRLGHLALYLSR